MKRVDFVCIALATLLASAPAIAQPAQGAGTAVSQNQRRGAQPLCKDAKGASYSQNAMIRNADGEVVRCNGGRWEPATDVTTRAQGQGAGQGQASGRGQGFGREPHPVNVKIDLTISDQTGTSQPVRKTISMLIADWGDGKVRSNGFITDARNIPIHNVGLNADASVRLVTDDKVRADITIEFTSTPAQALAVVNADTPRQPSAPTTLNETVTVLLTSGRPTIITQSADPLSDRKVTVEATATIIR